MRLPLTPITFVTIVTAQLRYVFGLTWGLHDKMGKYAVLKANEGVNIKYTFNVTCHKYDQVVSVNGNFVSTMSFEFGLAKNSYTEVECQDSCRGAVNAHKNVSTAIVLASPDQNFATTHLSNNIAAESFRSHDGGETWKISLSQVDRSVF
ncbi:hypothetical protein EJ08DRAFT_702719 [Tothia fuscella]|uniref:Uncharacterized protein n=1 Tax=Tothia fuscella TaxID=1048955 RepID=A0A9P4NFP6_9PEZI|nr:hypothetical protein EJ08DRAFT_702719 [Tothia fuscella]